MDLEIFYLLKGEPICLLGATLSDSLLRSGLSTVLLSLVRNVIKRSSLFIHRDASPSMTQACEKPALLARKANHTGIQVIKGPIATACVEHNLPQVQETTENDLREPGQAVESYKKRIRKEK